jgi:hypothetical protein
MTSSVSPAGRSCGWHFAEEVTVNLTVSQARWFKSPEGQARAIELLEAEFGEGSTEKP